MLEKEKKGKTAKNESYTVVNNYKNEVSIGNKDFLQKLFLNASYFYVSGQAYTFLLCKSFAPKPFLFSWSHCLFLLFLFFTF